MLIVNFSLRLRNEVVEQIPNLLLRPTSLKVPLTEGIRIVVSQTHKHVLSPKRRLNRIYNCRQFIVYFVLAHPGIVVCRIISCPEDHVIVHVDINVVKCALDYLRRNVANILAVYRHAPFAGEDRTLTSFALSSATVRKAAVSSCAR